MPPHKRRGGDPQTIDRLEYLGGNLSSMADWTPSAWTDLIRNGRCYFEPGMYSGPFVASSPTDGSPTAATRAIIASATLNSGFQTGVYKGQISADVSVVLNGASNVALSNLVRSPGLTTFDLTVTGPPVIVMDIGAAAPGLQLIHPGYSTGAPPLLRTEAIDHYKQFACLRMMDPVGTNNKTEVNWADRIPSYMKVGEKSWEAMINLANTIYSAPDSKLRAIWICVGSETTPAYWQSLATLVRALANSGLIIYIEYANEVWNSGFQQFNRVLAAANAEVAGYGGIGDLNYDGSSDQYTWMKRLWARRVRQLAQTFMAEFGETTAVGRIRTIYAGQFTGPSSWTTPGLQYLTARYPEAVSSYVYALSGAPYYQGTQAEMDAAADGDALLAVLRTSGNQALPTLQTPLAQWVTLSNTYGLRKPVAYECGPHTNFATNRAVKQQAHINSGMGLLMKQAMGMAWAAGWGMHCHYLVSPGQFLDNNENSLWTSSQSFGGAGDAKHQALLSMGPTALRAYTG